MRGVEPPRPFNRSLDPESSASANFATSAANSSIKKGYPPLGIRSIPSPGNGRTLGATGLASARVTLCETALKSFYLACWAGSNSQQSSRTFEVVQDPALAERGDTQYLGTLGSISWDQASIPPARLMALGYPLARIH